MDSLARTLVVTGALLIATGLLLHWSPSGLGLGRLPGDLRIERPGFRLYVPITTSLLLSVVLSLILWAVSKLR